MEQFIESFLHLKTMLSQHPMFAAGILLIIGYLLGKLASLFRLPHITGYIIAGLLMSESITGIFPSHMGESFTIITEMALGMIALTIGGEFSWVKLKRMGKGAVIITLVQIFATFICVALGLYLFKMELPFALILGAIASATAPAATVAIVQSLRAHGLFIDYLYGVVALDDAGCVILFGIVFAITSSLLKAGGEAISSSLIVIQALLKVLLSIIIGALYGILLHYMIRKKKNQNEVLVISLGIIFFSTAIAIVLHLSPLLTNMAAGAVLINLSARNHRVFKILEPLTPPIYALFFVIAGTELNPSIFLHRNVFILGAVYILFRALGKYGGVYLGCIMSNISGNIKKYLGYCMLPQAGVALGLALFIQASPITKFLDPAHIALVETMVNIVLMSVFVNELIGPPLSKMAIIKGNEMEE